MAILSAELDYFAPESGMLDDTDNNGGRLSDTEITTGGVQITFPHVLRAERLAGSTKWRKIFCKVSNDDDDTLQNPMIWLDAPTPADDWIVMFPGTQQDIQSATLVQSPTRIWGCASLLSSVAATDTTVTVDVEDSTITGMFADGDTIRITNMPTPDSGTGNEEFHVINGTPSVTGTEVTITITESGGFANAYLTGDSARVSSVYEPSDVECSVDNWVETSTAGTYDETTYPVVCDNIGTIEQEWTLTFNDDNGSFTIRDEDGTSVGTWDYDDAGPAAPINPDFTGKPYFTLDFAGFNTSWLTDDTIVFETHPPAVPIWERRTVPINADTLSGNSVVLVMDGESV